MEFNKKNSWERIQFILEREGMNKNSFSEAIGLSSNVTITRIIKEKRKASPYTCKKITDRFPQYSYEWILEGKGEMLKENTTETNTEATNEYRLVPLVNMDSVGGIHSQNEVSFDDPEYVMKMIAFNDAREGDICIPVTGTSMIPTCPPGSVALIREVCDWKQYFGYGNIFVILLKDDRRIIKEVAKCEDNPKDFILCISHNKSVSDEELPKRFISRVWKVIKILINEGW